MVAALMPAPAACLPASPVPDEDMRRVYEVVRTPYKYGIVLRGEGGDMVDCPQVVRMGALWVMFYFGAFWRPGAFDAFAVSRDLIHWTKWTGPDLVAHPTSRFPTPFPAPALCPR